LPDATTASVSVAVWYDVGSKNDPAGRSGFAHLFEHLMFKATANMPTEDFLRKYAPNTTITRPMGPMEAPISNQKAREVLGFKETHPWRNYVKT
jgi:hypothetical protein